jgi:TfoX/Sxy family transcriptional regulator of competence genes
MSPEAEELTERIRNLIGHKPGVIEKKMFGGSGFMLYGNMVAGAMSTGEVLLRADPQRMNETLSITGASPMKMGERIMTGFYTVDFDAIADDDDLKTWIDRSWAYVKTMPPKDAKPAKKPVAKKAPASKAPAKKAAAKKAPAKKAARMAR